MIEMRTVTANHTAGLPFHRSPFDSWAEGHDGPTIRSPSATTSYQRYRISVFFYLRLYYVNNALSFFVAVGNLPIPAPTTSSATVT